MIELDLVLPPKLLAKIDDSISSKFATIAKAPLAIKLEVSKKEECHITTLLIEASIFMHELKRTKSSRFN